MRDVTQFIEQHKYEVEAIRAKLATDFDTPAQRIINSGFSEMGAPRFDSAGDDLWEMISCQMTTYCVKVRQTGKKSWAFLTSKGGTNRLRIHASEIRDKGRAETIAAEINQENKGVYEAKVEVFSTDEPRTTPHVHAGTLQTYEGTAEDCPFCSPELKAANRVTEANRG